MKKIFRHIHLWLSLPFGLVITITCLTGAILLLEQDITKIVQRDILYVKEVKEAPIPLDKLVPQIASTLDEGVTIASVSITSNPKRTYTFSLSKPRRATICVNQYTGEVTGSSARLPFFATVLRLHRFLLDERDADSGIFWGKSIVGVSTLLFVFILLTGVVLWWPTSFKSLSNLVTIHCSKGWSRFWIDTHIVGGIYVWLFLLALAFTGLTWSFPWYSKMFYKALNSLPQVSATSPIQSYTIDKGDAIDDKSAYLPYGCWQGVYEQMAQTYHRYASITLSDGKVKVKRRHIGNQNAADNYTFDKRTGQLTSCVSYDDTSVSSRMRGLVYSIHVGNWAGLPSRILTFVVAILGATLPLTGYYMWIKRLFSRKKKSSKKIAKKKR